jgi:hypothetical protein
MESAAAALSMLESRVEFEQMSNAAVLSHFFYCMGFVNLVDNKNRK